MVSHNSFECRRELHIDGQTYTYYDLNLAEENGLAGISSLPFSLKVLLENLLRHEDGKTVKKKDIEAIAAWVSKRTSTHEIAYRPVRVLMQDFTGVPAVVDLAAMRDAMKDLKGDPRKINPSSCVDLVVDHSVMVDSFGNQHAFQKNVAYEYERNGERYQFLRWGQEAFDNFRVVPPGTGICHQVNLEYLAQTVWVKEEKDGTKMIFPDTLVGTDSHTTMVNALSVLGWGVGGIEAEAAMLGQPVSMLIPEVVGFKLTGRLPEGITATDLVLTITETLRKKGVVGKFVEFYGEGLDDLTLEDQATIANMAPEYGATCGFFPVDTDTLRYLRATGRNTHRVALVEAYAKIQGLYRDEHKEPVFTDTVSLNLDKVEAAISGPKRPQDRIVLSAAQSAFSDAMKKEFKRPITHKKTVAVTGENYALEDGHIVIAAITSCTNTSNPSVLVAAGLLAQKALEKGLTVKPWVKTSFAPGSQVVSDYLQSAGLQDCLDKMGFNLVGYGCTTCIGNSGPLPEKIAQAIEQENLVACSVLSGNRNFEGRINPHVRANYLASPPLVLAYAIAGSMTVNLNTDPLGQDQNGLPVYLKDIWPKGEEIAHVIRQSVHADMFAKRYRDVFKGDENWQKIGGSKSLTYHWEKQSTYVQKPEFFTGITSEPEPVSDIQNARIIALFADSITTDHISPAGAIAVDSPAGLYLKQHGVERKDFNSYGSRRGNHQVMMRGTFANIRIKNQMLDGMEGGRTRYHPTGEIMPIYDAAMHYAKTKTPLVVLAGKEYGTGSSRDWAAKGTRLLGIKAVIAESFERIHRSNLIGMGVLPLQFPKGQSWKSLELTGEETIHITHLKTLKPRAEVQVHVKRENGKSFVFKAIIRVDTENELEYYQHGGILHYVLRELAAA